MTDEQALLNQFQKLLSSSRNIVTGWSNGGSPGGSITVRLDSPLGGRNFVNAIAWGNCPPGVCVAVCDEQGNWYALAQATSRKVRESVRQRHTRKKLVIPEIYPFKLLFQLGNKFFVGGDRATPKEIYQSFYLVDEGFLSNQGEKLTDFVAGFRYYLGGKYGIATFYADATKNWSIDPGTGAENLRHMGAGFWQAEQAYSDPIALEPPVEIHTGSVFEGEFNVTPGPQTTYSTGKSSFAKFSTWPVDYPDVEAAIYEQYEIDYAQYTLAYKAYELDPMLPKPIAPAIPSPGSAAYPNYRFFDRQGGQLAGTFVFRGLTNSTAAIGFNQVSQSGSTSFGKKSIIEKETREVGYSNTSNEVPGSYPACTESNSGQVIPYSYDIPLSYSIKTVEKLENETNSLKTYSASNGNLSIKDGSFTKQANTTEIFEQRDTFNQIDGGLFCQGYAARFGNRYWNQWDDFSIQKNEYFKKYNKQFNSKTSQKYQIAILPGVYKDCIFNELIAQQNSYYDTYSFYGGSGVYTFTRSSSENTTKESNSIQLRLVSNQGRFAIFEERINTTSKTSNYSKFFGSTTINGEFGEDLPPSYSDTSTKISQEEVRTYLYDALTGSNTKIGSNTSSPLDVLPGVAEQITTTITVDVTESTTSVKVPSIGPVLPGYETFNEGGSQHKTEITISGNSQIITDISITHRSLSPPYTKITFVRTTTTTTVVTQSPFFTHIIGLQLKGNNYFANFVENTNPTSPIKGTIYAFEESVYEDFTKKNNVGFVIAYDLTEIGGFLQFVKQPISLQGKIAPIRNPTPKDVSYYPVPNSMTNVPKPSSSGGGGGGSA